eukprot:TRINITY_DN7676_c0_g1_i9.p1 TRINITY_DN7676_c0_g1~~TRINITY_DN7676_c0_g1_i9.p1  ORF type:complete len:139 (+),score=19.18 TRINITY_DN7676_c0_g1_i9:89-505(+)
MLAQHNVPYKGLIAILYVILKGQEEASFVAAMVYFTMIQIPGNYNVFNPMVLRAAMNLLKLWARVTRDAAFASRKAPKKKRGKSRDSEKADDDEDEEKGSQRSSRNSINDENEQGERQEIGRAVQQECRDRSRMPSSA